MSLGPPVGEPIEAHRVSEEQNMSITATLSTPRRVNFIPKMVLELSCFIVTLFLFHRIGLSHANSRRCESDAMWRYIIWHKPLPDSLVSDIDG